MTGSHREQACDTSVSVAAIIGRGYTGHADRFREIVGRAARRFTDRQWTELQEDAVALIDLYNESVQGTLGEIEHLLGEAIAERGRWGPIRDAYAELIADRPDPEIAATFFNSITRRVFATVGIDDQIEFASIVPVVAPPAPTRIVSGTAEDVIRATLDGAGLPQLWKSLNRDVRLAAAEVAAAVRNRGEANPIDGAEILDQVFYRGQGAYLVGRITAGDTAFPIALCVHHTSRGLLLGAVLTEPSDISVLFSYTRSAFHVSCGEPAATVDYLQGLMPTKRRAELYSTIGYRKHAKTELYSELMRHVAATDEQFEHARGIRGMVMIVFTIPGFDVVFKVIRDRFPYPKQTTRR